MSGIDDVLRRQQEHIDKVGWSVMAVLPTDDDPGSPYAYTVGLTAHAYPELVIAGLPPHIAHALLNDLAGRVYDRAERFHHGQHIPDLISGHRCVGGWQDPVRPWAVAVRHAWVMQTTCPRPVLPPRSAFAGFRFPAEVIVVGVRWYLRYGLSYRDVEELLAERGVEVDHVSVFRWVHRFSPLLADAARFARHAPGDRWYVDETYVKIGGSWRYVYRAIDQHGQVIDVLVSTRRDATAARRFFTRALTTLKVKPTEVVTDAAPVYPAVLDELIPAAWHHVERYSNNPIEADHGRLKHRLRVMRGLVTDATAQTIIAGHAFVQNLRRSHYELGIDAPPALRVAAAFAELAQAI